MYYNIIVDLISEVEVKKGFKEKRIKKYFLCDAESIGDAETKVHKLFSKGNIEFEIKSIVSSKIEEVLK